MVVGRAAGQAHEGPQGLGSNRAGAEEELLPREKLVEGETSPHFG